MGRKDPVSVVVHACDPSSGGSRLHVQGQPPLYSELEANLTSPRTRVQASEPVYKMLGVVVGTGDPSTGDMETENRWSFLASKSHLISVPQTHEWSLSQRRQVDGTQACPPGYTHTINKA